MAKNKKRADGRYSCQVYLGKGPDGKRKYIQLGFRCRSQL